LSARLGGTSMLAIEPCAADEVDALRPGSLAFPDIGMLTRLSAQGDLLEEALGRASISMQPSRYRPKIRRSRDFLGAGFFFRTTFTAWLLRFATAKCLLAGR
jgi:hypothetical protein